MNPESLRSSSPNPSSDRLVFPTPQATSLHRKLFAHSQQLLKDLPDCIPPQARSDSKVLLLYLRDLQEKKISLPKQDIPHILRSLEQILSISDILKKLEDTQGDTKQVQALYGEHIREFLSNEKHQQIIESNKVWHKAFFDQTFDLPPIPDTITNELLEFWEKNHFKLIFLPPIDMTEDKNFPGWKKKPGKRYTPDKHGIEFFDEALTIQNLQQNKDNPHLKGLTPTQLPGCWMLVDARKKPNYEQGNQTYEDDELIQTVLMKLSRTMDQSGHPILNPEAREGKRNNIRPSIFQKPDFWQALKEALNLPDNATIRLPRAIEANVLGQGPDWDETNTYEWFEEMYSSSKRLVGGSSDYGGASYVRWYDGWSDYIGFRPQIVFSM